MNYITVINFVVLTFTAIIGSIFITAVIEDWHDKSANPITERVGFWLCTFAISCVVTIICNVLLYTYSLE